ncbi:MAG: hypothetical protein KatS3mg082_1423 [Nitrospiraceae bacterium]|nr:MAG: hypothetical protein KatS3mg082_1423 [Nitrospiraceae bacterium]
MARYLANARWRDASTCVVPSSDGTKEYRVIVDPKYGDAVSCTCPGFRYRGRCVHLAVAEKAWRDANVVE